MSVSTVLEKRVATRSSSRIALFALLIVFPFLVATLAANIAKLRNENLGLGGGVVATTSGAPPPPVSVANQAPFQLGGGGDFYLYFYIGLAAIVGTLLFLYLRANAKGLEQSRNRLGSLLGIGIVVLVFGSFVLFADYAGQYFASAGSSPGNSPTAFQYIAVFAVIGGAALGSIVLFLRMGRRRSPYASVSNPVTRPLSREEELEEVKTVFDETVYSLAHGSDQNLAIVQCYKALLGILKKAGVPSRASLTPRELEAVVLERVPVSPEILHELTILFENARYGKESLSPEDAAKAQDCLEKMSQELKAMVQRGA